MHIAEHAYKKADERGPRWAVVGHIRPGEAECMYMPDADRAEWLRGQWESQGRYQLRVYPPDGTFDLSALGKERQAAKAVFDDATDKLRAAVIAAVNADGRAEAEVARQAGVDRMTVRTWLGK